MNKTIEQPSKYIEIKQINIIKDYKINNKFDTGKIDFYNLNKRTDTSKIDKAFYMSMFKNDMRIRSIYTKGNSFIIEFWTTVESVEFYSQFFKMCMMSFISECDIAKHICCNNYVKQDQKHSYLDEIDKVFIKPTHKIENTSVKNDNMINNVFSNDKKVVKEVFSKKSVIHTYESFLARVEDFNKMGQIYSKLEIKKIKTLVNMGNKEPLFINSKELSVGIFSNVLIQEEIVKMSEDEIFIFLSNLGTDITAMACTKYGAYVVQKIITNILSEKNKALLCNLFIDNGRYLIFHSIGNYTIQKMLIFNNSDIKQMFIDELIQIVDSEIGYKVFNKNLSHFKNDKEEILFQLRRLDKTAKIEQLIDLLNKY